MELYPDYEIMLLQSQLLPTKTYRMFIEPTVTHLPMTDTGMIARISSEMKFDFAFAAYKLDYGTPLTIDCKVFRSLYPDIQHRSNILIRHVSWRLSS